ncbi:phage/plasmid primase, P4 family [Cryobacterium sp. M91]|uniref:phage/plasmid primase, P4 family n=1 Tax=Cryobacterium sp. M91 TaxID=2048294 RepID=UPI001304C2DD|nr:phage/plasmid primase, P4 family [Cryobacterium sp. M91]
MNTETISTQQAAVSSPEALAFMTPNAERAERNAWLAANARDVAGPGDWNIRNIPTDDFTTHKWPDDSAESFRTATPAHLHYLQWRANSEYVARGRGIHSAVRRDQKIEIEGFGGDALKNMTVEDNDCLVIPLYSLAHGPAHPVLFQVRPDLPRVIVEFEKDETGANKLDKKGEPIPVLGRDKKPKSRSVKFEAPAGAVRGSEVGQLPADVHPYGQRMLDANPAAIIAWTEGVAKADAILSAALREGLSIVPVALTGVTMGYKAGDAESGLAPTPVLTAETVGLIDHVGRTELLFWDADWRTNKNVGGAMVVFGQLLEAAGATVYIVDTPGVTKDRKGGVDDYLQAMLQKGSVTPLADLLATHLVTISSAENVARVYSDDDSGRSERLVDELLEKRSHTFDPTTDSWNSYDAANGIWTAEGRGANVAHVTKILTERDVADPVRYRNSRSAPAIKNAGIIASSDPSVQLRSDECDVDAYLLNTPSGVVDLLTGELLPHGPAYAMRKVTGVGYDPEAVSPVWDRFVLQSAGGDVEYVGFIQRFFGMALIGKTVEEVMGMITGGGQNGKSTMTKAITSTIGSYAGTMPAKAFTGDLTDEMLLELQGARLVLAAETGAGNALDEKALKIMTSSDTISGRGLYKSRVTFEPSATMALLTNHRPSIRAQDAGTWRRVRIMPFNNIVTEEQKDADLAMKLAAEAAGILRWLVDGALAFGNEGLGTCAVVAEATSSYRASQDFLGGFITECLIVGEPADRVHCRRADLKAAFDAYVFEQGRRTSWTLAAIREGLQERGVLPRIDADFEKRIKGYPTWYGVGLRSTSSAVEKAMPTY